MLLSRFLVFGVLRQKVNQFRTERRKFAIFRCFEVPGITPVPVQKYSKYLGSRELFQFSLSSAS
jgi:hypothetical protein